MKISLVSPVLSNRSGGAEYVLCSVGSAFAEMGHEVEILHYADDVGRPFFKVDDRVRYFNIKPQVAPHFGILSRIIRRLCLGRLGDKFPRLRWYGNHNSTVRWLKGYFSDYRPDLVIGFTAGCFSVVSKACSEMNIKYVLSVHNVPEKEFDDPARWDPNPIDRAKRKEAVLNAQAITVLSDSFVDYFSKADRKKIHVIPNFVELPDSFEENDKSSKRIISVGRLAPVKQHEILIHAWSRIHTSFPDWRVDIFGDGPLRVRLESIAEKLGVDTLTFRKPTANIWAEYSESSFMVHPAAFEGFGLVVLEAMHAELPVIAFSDCNGVNELISDGLTGTLVPASNDRIETLAEFMTKMINDADQRIEMGKQGACKAKDYSLAQSMQKWNELLQRI